MLRILQVAFAALLLFVVPVAASQQAVPAEDPAAVPDTPAQRAIDMADLSAYVDGLVQSAMQRDGIAGVTVAIVDREGPLLLRGYGVASAASAAVDPESTLFRIASISKTFTYLLGLQLVDEGALDLDRPANDYLPDALKLPDDGLPPVLVRHLFTHTAGYEDSAIGHLFVDRVDRVLPSHDYLVRHRPARVRTPGTVAVYSNYSVALLGALVAHVAGQPFDSLAEGRLFGPAGMRSTTFREPLREGDPRHAGNAFSGRWSEGFQRKAGGFAPQAFEHIAQIGPAGGASSTAADMGRYLRLLLRGGEIDGVQVLSPSAHARLLEPAMFRNAREVGGFSFGFFDERQGELRVLGHGGATSWFHSMLSFAPEAGIGVFISTNTDTGRRFASQFPGLVFQRYVAQARLAPLPVAKDFDAGRFVGSYNSQRTNFSRVEKLLLASTVQVADAEGKGLVVTAGGDSRRWLPEGGLVFRAAEGPGRIVFREDGEGRITGFSAAAGHVVFERAGPLEQVDPTLAIFGAAGLVSLLVLVGGWLRRGRRDPAAPAARRAAFWLYVSALAWLLFLLLLWRFASVGQADETALFYNYPGSLLTALLWSTPLLFLLTLVDVLHLRGVLGARGWGLMRKLRHVLVVALFVLACWLLWSWNMVGWKL